MHEKKDSGLSKLLTKKFDKTPNLAKKYLDTLEHQGLTIELVQDTQVKHVSSKCQQVAKPVSSLRFSAAI